MKSLINIETWNRKEHYHFFKKMDDPSFGVTVNIDFTNIYNKAKEKGWSFFAFSLHKIMMAVNATEEFRYRIEGDSLVCYDIIHPNPTIGREDGTFSFSYIEYNTDFGIFARSVAEVKEMIKNTVGLGVNENTSRLDVIHFSSIPWIQFTDLKQNMSMGNGGAIPKISTGKCFKQNGAVLMPVSVTVNHAVMDGYHLSRFLDTLQEFAQSE